MKNRYLHRLKSMYHIIRFEVTSFLLSLIGMIRVHKSFDKRRVNRLEIGAGTSGRKKGFITTDLAYKTDYPFDLRMGLPFPEQSLDFIYCEHTLEHFSYRDLIFLLKDCYRALKTNGKISISVPNARIYLTAYSHAEDFDRKHFCTFDTGLSFRSRIDYVNYIFYMDGHHRHMFDEESILEILRQVGFKDARLRNFDADLDLVFRKYESIYAQASK